MSSIPPGPNLRGAVDLSALTRRAAAGAAGTPAPGAEGADDTVFSADDASFQRVLELSSTVPVIVEIIAPGLEPALETMVRSYGGRLALAIVDGTVNPQIAQAFQVREVPTVAAVVAGKPLALFVGIPADAEVRQVLDQVLQLAQREGVTGSLAAGDEGAPDPDAEPVEPPLPPLHQEAFDAISAGNYEAAVDAYRRALAENPRDADAAAGLAQAALLARVTPLDPAAVRAAAAADPSDIDAALQVADLDLSGGHVEDAFARLLDAFGPASADDRARLRTRLLEHFEVVGGDDERVAAARRRLTNLLF